jgi:hypothetical protein
MVDVSATTENGQHSSTSAETKRCTHMGSMSSRGDGDQTLAIEMNRECGTKK